MKSWGSNHRSRSAPRFRGDPSAALVLVLACIVILSALVLAFLSRALLETQVSTASADENAADLFARGGVDSVIGELKQEITAGSVVYFTPTDVRDPNCVFIPFTNQTMVPYRMDAGAPANVLKRSSSTEPFYAGTFYNTSTWPAPQWAANFSTTNTGSTGRAISLDRWNEALLMPTANPAATNLTPVATFTPPDWIYMTRAGGPATTWNANLIPGEIGGSFNSNCVVGRYAYVVYDEGGLLDANAAGYPAGVTPAMVRNKASEGCADLTQIGLQGSDITALLDWRNPVSGASAQAYTNYLYNPPGNITYAAATNAFLTPAPGDRLFTSRQQLINFLTQNVANGDPTAIARMQAALPFLTHFSRELNAPSWYPTTNVGSGAYAYANNATNSSLTATNLFVPLARASSSFTDVSNLSVSTNAPVAFDRFPLSRLAWLGPNGAVSVNGTTPSAPQIQQSFGLAWDGANNAWKYVANTGAIQSSIATLSSLTGREPNFFELLKAGILSGSVGITPGQQITPYPSPAGIDARYTVSDQHIIQIGLAMIDQASPAFVPVRIEFGSNAGKSSTGDDLSLYGSKNLPFLYRMVFAPYRPTTEPSDGAGTNTMFDAWAEPVFWSPYVSAVTNTAPVQIRIRADGTNAGVNGQFGAETEAITTDVRQCVPEVICGGPAPGNGAGGGNGSYGSIFEIDSANAASLYSATVNPVMLNSLLTNGVVTPVINDGRAANPWIGGPANGDIYKETAAGNTYAGFWLGHVYAPNPPDPYDSDTNITTGQQAPYSTSIFYYGLTHNRPNHEFVVEANYGTAGAPNFLEIQRMTYEYTSGSYVEEYDNFNQIQRRLNFFTFNDPRTSRFGFDVIQPPGYNPSAPGPTPAPLDTLSMTNSTFPLPSASANGYFTNIIYAPITSSSTTVVPSNGAGSKPIMVNTFRFADNGSPSGSVGAPLYQDTDGVQRPADGWWSSGNANTLPLRQDTFAYRPVMLNRSFQSVGELGYVYRDMPWRSLNFCSTNTADAGLLDFFSLNDGYAGATNAPVIAGVLDLNTPHPEVLQALLNGAARSQLNPAYDVSTADATSMADAVTNITAIRPLLNKAEIATRLAPNDPTVQASATSEPGIDTNIKERREVMVRALGSAGQVRTWNLMIDVVAQTGHLPPSADSTGQFGAFIVTAEKRYWAHVAIDRYTGQVISLQLEPVSE